MMKDYAPVLDSSERAILTRGKSRSTRGTAFSDVARAVNTIVEDGKHALSECAFCGGHRNCIVQIHGAVRRHRVGRPHRSRQDDGLCRFGDQVKQKGGFFERVGPVQDDDAIDVGTRRNAVDAHCQAFPSFQVDIFAVDVRELLGADAGDSGQSRHGTANLCDIDRSGAIPRRQPGVFGAAGNRSARRDQRDMRMLVAQRERPDCWCNAEGLQSAAALDSIGVAIIVLPLRNRGGGLQCSAAFASACGRIFIRRQ
jgi:hypothetical protein